MAASPAGSLAVQYPAGVPVPGSLQLRRSLVTKTHKTRIMAAKPKPTVRYEAEAGVLAFAPSQVFRGNRISSQRDKTIVGAYPQTSSTSGIPEYTYCKLENNIGEELKLDIYQIWEGPPSLPVEADKIEGEEVEFKQGKLGGASAVLTYIFGEGNYRWIVAWSNSKDDVNKVYTDIVQVEEKFNWGEIKENLAKGENSSTTSLGYKSNITIDVSSVTPLMKAIIFSQAPKKDG